MNFAEFLALYYVIRCSIANGFDGYTNVWEKSPSPYTTVLQFTIGPRKHNIILRLAPGH